MIKFEDLLEKSIEEMQEILENDNEAFKGAVSVLTKEELNDQEAIIVTALEDYDKFLDEVNYELPEDTMFDHKLFEKSRIANCIVDFINRQEVDWQYSLGMYQVCKLWKSIGKEKTTSIINYKALDSTMRLLGNLKYKGYDDWKLILAINQYLTTVHDEYNKHTTYMIYLSHIHNTILNELNRESVPIMEAENV